MTERPQLLSAAPADQAIDLQELVGIAGAVEAEAVASYAKLAAAMARRGAEETAATFRMMGEMEMRHVDAVADWARSLHQIVPPAHRFAWRLPQEFAESWDEVRHSTLLTPYRALSIAVTNEERAFALYSYIAANAGDATVARAAETLAREELAHAAELRVHRRRAYRRERAGRSVDVPPKIASLEEFRALERDLERDISARHDHVSKALCDAGDAESAALLRWPGCHQRVHAPDAACRVDVASRNAAPDRVATLLRSALMPVERASEVYEDIVAHAAGEDVLDAAQAALQRTVARIGPLARRLGEIEGAA